MYNTRVLRALLLDDRKGLEPRPNVTTRSIKRRRARVAEWRNFQREIALYLNLKAASVRILALILAPVDKVETEGIRDVLRFISCCVLVVEQFFR